MSDELTLSNVTQDDFDTAEAALISLIRAEYPTLDLRKGTVLRDLLIRPASSVYALNSDRIDALQDRMSFQAMLANESSIDPDAADAILSNFSITRNSGAKASGQVRVNVDSARRYTLASGFQFSTLDGLTYETTRNYTIQQDADTNSDEVELTASGTGTYYFIVEATASDTGNEYSIDEGTALDISSHIFGFISAEAYSSFTGGLDEEAISEVVARLPSAISYRALESGASIDSKLRNHFDGTSVNIQDLSSQGYGDRVQLRDKHNPAGFAVGSRVDIYARTFTSLQTAVLQKTGTRTADNQYEFEISSTDAPGFYAIKIISEVDSAINPELDFDSLPAIGSYDFSEVRSASGISDTFHDISSSNSVIETAYSVYQQSTVTVTGVPFSDDTHGFKVEVYYAPGLGDIQSFIDGDDERNLEADYIVRMPLVCLVGVNAKVYYDSAAPVDISEMTNDIYNYINSRSFTRRLTRSEISHILHTDGAVRVDLDATGMMLQGIVRDAGGAYHTLKGDSLDLETIADKDNLLAPETCVFGVERNSIYLELEAEST